MKKVSLKQFSIYSLIFLSGVVFTLLISSTYAANSYVGKASDITFDNTSTTLNSNNINDAIDELADKANFGNVSASDVLSGKTALSKGIKINGSMVNRGAVTSTINPGGSYTIPAGYHNGSGIIKANPNQNSGTYTPTARSTSIDMGANNTYRYVNTNSIPNTNSSTYTYASGSTGGKVDLGATNSYRYVDATNVYNKGKNDGKSQGGNWTAVFEVKGHFQNWENQVTWGRSNKGDPYYFTITVTAKCVNGTVTTSFTQSRTNGSTIVQFHYDEYYMGEGNPYYDWKGVEWYLDSISLKSYTIN